MIVKQVSLSQSKSVHFLFLPKEDLDPFVQTADMTIIQIAGCEPSVRVSSCHCQLLVVAFLLSAEFLSETIPDPHFNV